MNINDFKAQIQAATDWFFDPMNEQTETGVDPRDLHIETGHTVPHPNAPSEVVARWFDQLKSDVLAGNPALKDICEKQGFSGFRVLAERKLDAEFKKCTTPPAPGASLHSRLRIVNLSIKSLRVWPAGGRDLANAIYEYGESALNEPVIALAKKLIPGFAYSATGTDPQVNQKHMKAQEAIKDFCAAHGTKAVIFDVIARMEHVATV